MAKVTNLDVNVRTAHTRRIVRTCLTFTTAAVLGIFVGLPLVAKVLEGVIAGL
ncbi:hypothetical protein SAMN05216274_104118 [Cryobacterium levicorallinum]|uniref:Uncharacterized protein n=1 Tax=Cryobacterium levicorallinum TaxID=995038 RepID=A0ABY1EBQ7_9MICO|nr:hypothetical protein SAMN05216274_104118 [Cryobacterium levicorallinum]